MRKIFFLFFLFLNPLSSESQTWLWAHAYDYGSCDRPFGFGLDEDNYTYLLTNEYYDHGVTAHSYMYLGKYDPNGVEIWRDTVPTYLKRSVTDRHGNTYCAGGMRLVKYNTNGSLLWDVFVYAPIIEDLCINSNGDIQIISYGYTSSMTKSNILCMHDNGTLNWSFMRDSVGSQLGATDHFGNLYVTSDTYPDSATGNQTDLVKYDSSGNVVFTKVIPHVPDDMVCDKDGNVYISGTIQSGAPTMIDGTIHSAPFGSPNPNTYLLKYDSAGNLIWFKLLHNMRCPLATDKNGFLYLVAGGKSVEIDSLNVTEPNAFQIVVKLDGTGNIIWSTHTNTTSSTGTLSQISVLTDSADNVYLAGGIKKQHNFGSCIAYGEHSYDDNYIAKLSQQGPTGISEPLFVSTDLTVSPNPTQDVIHVSYTPSAVVKELKLNLRNAEGKQLFFEALKNISQPLYRSLDLSNYPAGIYLVELEVDGLKMVKKMVLN